MRIGVDQWDHARLVTDWASPSQLDDKPIIQVGLRDAKKSGMVRFQGYNIAEWTDDFSTVDVAIGLIQRLRESMDAANFASAENKFATPATAIAVMAHHLNLKKV